MAARHAPDASRPIRAIIWDVDGTIADTLELCVHALGDTIREFGGPDLSHDEVRARFGPTEEGILAAEVGERWPDAFQAFLDRYERHHDEEALAFAGVCGVIRELADAGVRQAVVTGKGPQSAAITIDHVGLHDCFDEIAAGSDGGSIKEQEISRIVGRWGLSGDEVAYVGDAPSDVTHARAAGVVVVSAAWKPGIDTAELVELGPDVLLESEDELAAWVADAVARP